MALGNEAKLNEGSDEIRQCLNMASQTGGHFVAPDVKLETKWPWVKTVGFWGVIWTNQGFLSEQGLYINLNQLGNMAITIWLCCNVFISITDDWTVVSFAWTVDSYVRYRFGMYSWIVDNAYTCHVTVNSNLKLLGSSRLHFHSQEEIPEGKERVYSSSSRFQDETPQTDLREGRI